MARRLLALELIPDLLLASPARVRNRPPTSWHGNSRFCRRVLREDALYLASARTC